MQVTRRSAARRSLGAAMLAAGFVLVGGCNEGGLGEGLRSAGAGAAPDEFLVLPTRPLELPADLSSLPPPVTGAPNRVDARPRAEAVAGLTGQTGAAGTVAAPGLVSRVGPVDPAIRSRLAQEDAIYRQENRTKVLEWLFGNDIEAQAYRGMALDAGAEFERLRAGGVRVPAAPPEAVEN